MIAKLLAESWSTTSTRMRQMLPDASLHGSAADHGFHILAIYTVLACGCAQVSSVLHRSVDTPCMRHIRHAGEPAQNARELVQIGDGNCYEDVSRSCVPIGSRRHSLDAQPLQRQDIRHISDQPAAIVGGHGNLHHEAFGSVGGPLNL